MNSPITALEQLTINNRCRNYLKEIAKWTFFLSIIGFLGIGFMIILGIFSKVLYGEAFNAIYSNQLRFDFSLLMTIIYLFFAGIYILPVMYLFKFSKRPCQLPTSSITYNVTVINFNCGVCNFHSRIKNLKIVTVTQT